jgi:hypothetical protein
MFLFLLNEAYLYAPFVKGLLEAIPIGVFETLFEFVFFRWAKHIP